MAEQQEFATHIVDLLADFGPCDAKRMFGGIGIFHQGLMIALIADGSLYLKADHQTRENFETEGCEAFTYYKKEKQFKLSYYLAPENFFEDEHERTAWARLAWEAALRKPRKKKPVAENLPFTGARGA